MKRKPMLIIMLIMLLMMPATAVYSMFGMDLGLAYDYLDEDDEKIHLVGISLRPDLELGNWGLGLDVTLNFHLDDKFRFRDEDWVPEFDGDTVGDHVKEIAGLYLPIIRYVRYGHKGDELYGQIGMIDSYTLGTGVFMDQYSNTRLLPRHRIVGAALDIDGSLFNFPYAGVEMMAGNISQWDVMGARMYSRPFSFLAVPVINEMQVGGSYVTDRNPAALDNHLDSGKQFPEGDEHEPDAVNMFGVDVVFPLLHTPMLTMDFFGDVAFQGRPKYDDAARAYRTGTRGRIIDMINYMVDVTLPYDGFVPSYMDKRYDENRRDRYEMEIGDGALDYGENERVFLRGSAGFDTMDENLVFDLLVTGETDSSFDVYNPSMTAFLHVGEDLSPFFFFDATYHKQFDDKDDSVSMPDFLEGIAEFNKNAFIEVSGNVRYKLLLTRVGINIAYDEDGKRTSSVSVAGDLQLDGLFGFLQ